MTTVELITDHGKLKKDVVSDAPLSIRGLSVAYGGAPVVFSASCTFASGRLSAIVGPNGAGKSSLLKAALGIVKPLAGEVRFFGRGLADVRQLVAYVPQRASIDWDFPARVIDVVTMGLYREIGPFRFAGRAHKDRALQALARVNMDDFASRQIGQLSGGQQQRVFLARALVQSPELYLLDEPFSGVDVATEHAIIEVLRGLRDQGRTIVCVHHNLQTVKSYFDDVVLLNRRVIAAGPVDRTFTADHLQATYGMGLSEAQLKALQASPGPVGRS